MAQLTLHDGADAFNVTLLRAATPTRSVLFSVGGGGNPERHLPLLERLAETGCNVAAPHCERLTAMPSEHDLMSRVRRLQRACELLSEPALPLIGVGHSIGAMLLVALAGGQAWTRAGVALQIAPQARLKRLALLAPAVGFFRAPGALEPVDARVAIWAGGLDTITPASDAEWLRQTLPPVTEATLELEPQAGHFSFMHAPPPQSGETLPDRDAFLARLENEICRFVNG